MQRKQLLLFFAVVILLTFSAGAFAQRTKKPDEKLNVAKEGVGLGGIAVGRSTMTDVVKKFGTDYKWVKHGKYSFQMAYKKIGLSFYICQSDQRKQIFDIEIRAPYRAKTGRGIILGQSTVEDILKIYGKSKEGLQFRGVNFYYVTKKGKKVVSVIDIVENSGIRQCTDLK